MVDRAAHAAGRLEEHTIFARITADTESAGRRRAALAIAATLAAAVLATLALMGGAPALGGGDHDTTAAWSAPADGSPTIATTEPQPSLVFPPGTSYEEALTSLAIAAGEGRLPAEAALAPPLPAEVVVVDPATADGALRLSLTAPFGWNAEDGAIRPPSFSLPGHLSAAEVSARIREATTGLPEGARVDVPQLLPCQRAVGDVKERPACD